MLFRLPGLAPLVRQTYEAAADFASVRDLPWQYETPAQEFPPAAAFARRIDLRDFAYVAGKMSLGPQSSFGVSDGNFQVSDGANVSNVFWLEGNYSSAYLSAHHLAFAFSDDAHKIGATSSDGTLVKLVSTTA